VYWARGSERQLKELNPEKTLAEQLQNAFSIKDSPIWMDSSTSDYCRKLEKIVGGPEKVGQQNTLKKNNQQAKNKMK